MHTVHSCLYNPRLCYFCAHRTMHTVKLRACVGRYKYNYKYTACVGACACAPRVLHSLSSLVNSRLTAAVSSLILVTGGSFASLIATYTRCYLQCECYRRFCAVVRPFVSGFWRNCGVTRCKIAQNSCAKSRKIAAIAWYITQNRGPFHPG